MNTIAKIKDQGLDVLLYKQAKDLARFIGNTPLFPLEKILERNSVSIYSKLEWYQLSHSVKARAAYFIIRDAIKKGYLNKDKVLLDATSGNTGIAYAAICASLDIPITLCLPQNISKERVRILNSFGAELVFTSELEGTDGAQVKAKKLVKESPDKYYYADQYSNPNNWKAHYLTTAEEIWSQTGGKITHFVAGIGTSGTFTGTGKRLKELNPNIQLIGLQPSSPMHGLEGWKHLETAKIPSIYDQDLADDIVEVDSYEAYDWINPLSRKTGLLVSPSAAANLVGAIKVASSISEGMVVTTFADDISKYYDIL